MATEPTHITDHAARGDEDRLSQFDNSPALAQLADVKMAQVQLLEDTIWDVLTGMDYETAIGEALTRLGKIVGWPRHGVSDDEEFRRLVRVGAQINRCDGLAREVQLIVSQLLSAALPTVHYIQRHKAHFGLQWEISPDSTTAWLQVINGLMPRLASMGVSWDLVEGPADTCFTLDDDDLGLDQGELARRIDLL